MPLYRTKRKRLLDNSEEASTSNAQSKVHLVDNNQPHTSRGSSQQTSQRPEPVIVASGRNKKTDPYHSSSQSRAAPNEEPPVIPVASTSRHETKPRIPSQDIDEPESVFTPQTRNTQVDPPTSNQAETTEPLKQYSAVSISQMFNQFMLSQQCVSEKKLIRLIEEYNKRFSGRAEKTLELKSFVNRFNKLFRPDGLQIKRTYDPIGHTYYHILSGTFDRRLSKFNTWSQKESGYYFLVLDEMFSSFLRNVSEDEEIRNPASGDYSFLSISTSTAVNLSRKVTGTHLTMSMAEKLLARWATRKWFTFMDSDRRITVGVRTLSLMSSYLHSKFSIFLCNVCTFTCLIGLTCHKCHLCIHYHCLEGGTAQNHPCPTCNVAMSGVQYLVPKEVHEEMEE